jgi:PAS domain S-box-containing protein
MSEPRFQFGWLNDRRLAAHALSPTPVWLWHAQAPRILWANPIAAAIFDAPSPQAASTLAFETQHAAALQISRLAASLTQGGAPRLERLRGFGAALGGTLICLCSRIALADNSSAILVVATERAGKELALPERARRLLADIAPAAAIFTADGELIEAQNAARERLDGRSDLVALDAATIAREASLHGAAKGDTPAGHIEMLKLDAGATFALLAAFTGPQSRPTEAPLRETITLAPPIVPNPAATEARPRRGSFRFVWQMDASLCFTLGTAEFARLLGPQTASALDRPWPEIAAALMLDTDGRLARALTARDTWSGIVIEWPVDGTSERLPIEMSALPVFDRDRQFGGFRGFGICRDMDKLDRLQRQRAAAPKPAEQPQQPETNGKVLPFPVPQAPIAPEEAPKLQPAPVPEEPPALSPGEHSAFQELARELSERLKKPPARSGDGEGIEEPFVAPAPSEPARIARNDNAAREASEGRPILERLPVGILVYRLNNLLYANRAFLDWTGYDTLDALANAGGLDSLFIESNDKTAAETKNGARTLTISTVNGDQKPVEGRLFGVSWHDENALVLMINTQASPVEDTARAASDAAALHRLESENSELSAILDTATDGVLVLGRGGRVLSANRSAAALFGYEPSELAERSLTELLAPESRQAALSALDRLAQQSGTTQLPDAGREALGRVSRGGLVPLFITVGRIENSDKYCAVLRDLTAWKRTEEELINARQEAEKASTAKSEFLAKISHEIRTPLNAIIGFSEVMMDERFGAIGNDRYRQYLKDIHTSGGHLISLLNDLLDLSKIEAGKLDLTFITINLNDIVQQCVAMMQQEANHERVIIRTSLHPQLPPIVADARSVRQIALNILSNSIKYTGAGGQVIVSTAVDEDHEVSFRVRDTGAGMSEKELQTALEPFRQLSTSARWGATGTGLGLPITKALAEANHARFRITSEVDAGTLVEVAFPATRVLAK